MVNTFDLLCDVTNKLTKDWESYKVAEDFFGAHNDGMYSNGNLYKDNPSLFRGDRPAVFMDVVLLSKSLSKEHRAFFFESLAYGLSGVIGEEE